jgi:hypothetical protein
MTPKEPSQRAFLDLKSTKIELNTGKAVQHSVISSMLPAVVQNRIPALPSLRRSILNMRSRSKGPTIESDISTPTTPPPGYTSRPTSGTVTPEQESPATSEDELESHSDLSERPNSSRSLPPPFAPSEVESGINWKYANQGMVVGWYVLCFE